MASPVGIFNGSSRTIDITVNGGPQIAINGAGPAQAWQPQSPAPGAGPTFERGNPGPNVVGSMGHNIIHAFVNGIPWGNPFSFSLPYSRPVGSLQIYVFGSPEEGAKWVLLADGTACAM